MQEQIIIRISLRYDVPLRWPYSWDYSARSPLPSKQRARVRILSPVSCQVMTRRAQGSCRIAPISASTSRLELVGVAARHGVPAR
jgi:hypothetical protein